MATESIKTMEGLLSDPKQIYKAVLDKQGATPQIEMLIEECSELIAAVKRMQRGRTDNLPVIEELADVEIMLEQMKLIYPPYMIHEMKLQKLTRLVNTFELLQT